MSAFLPYLALTNAFLAGFHAMLFFVNRWNGRDGMAAVNVFCVGLCSAVSVICIN